MSAPFRRTYPEFAAGYATNPEDAAAVARSKINLEENERIISMAISLVPPHMNNTLGLWLALATAVIEARNLDENGAPL